MINLVSKINVPSIYIYNIYVSMMTDFYFDRNIFDWICYIFLLVCISTHLADIIQHTTTIARAHIRLMAVTIILLWLRLMKVVRCFTLLGKLVFLLPFFRIIQCHIFVPVSNWDLDFQHMSQYSR